MKRRHAIVGTLLFLLSAFSLARDDDGSAQPAPLAAQSLLQAIAQTGKRLVAVGDYGIVVLSDDDGAHWRQAQSVPTRTTLTGVTFVDDKQGWAVGHGGVVLHSVDGGERWAVQTGEFDSENSLFSVQFSDAMHGIAVGAFGYAIRTGDGGKTWQQVTVGEGEDAERHLNGIFVGNNGRWLIAAEIGGVFISDDRGEHWRLVNLPYAGSVWGGFSLADRSLLVWGMVGHALRSTDNGESWTELATNTDQSLTTATQLPDGRVVLAGLGGAVAVGDAAWQFRAQLLPERQLITAALTRANDVLLLTANGIRPLRIK